MDFGGIRVLNLFAFRATSPDDMKTATDPVGPENDGMLEKLAGRASMGDMTIAAWGAHGSHQGRDRKVLSLLCLDLGIALHALVVNADGTPRHPLYVPKAAVSALWMDRAKYLGAPS